MSTPAGRRDSPILIERATATQSADGSETTVWSTWAKALAAVRFGTSAERRQAAAEQASQTATFRVLATSKTRAVTATDRILKGGEPWDIVGAVPVGRAEIEITATRTL